MIFTNNSNDTVVKITDYIEKNLCEKRKIHTYSVRDMAVQLADYYSGGDEKSLLVKKAELSALFHDMYRCASAQSLNCYIKLLDLDKKYLDNTNLAHGKIAAIIMERDYKVNDKDIINSVSWHTTGRPNMSLLEKIVYIADAVELGREYPGVQEIRDMAFVDIDKACLMSLERSISYIESRGDYMDENTVLAEQYLKNKVDKKEEGNE